MNQNIKSAVYVALTGGLFYYAAKYLKMDTSPALFLGTAVGQILSTKIEKDVQLNEII